MKNKLLLVLLILSTYSIAQVPNWTWAKNISSYFNSKQDITAVDNAGNVYMVGDFNTTSTSINGITLTNTSEVNKADGYILKFDSLGNLLWHKQIGTLKDEGINGISTDDDNNIYINGSYGANITLGTTTLTGANGGSYIAKLNSNGDFIWAKKINFPPQEIKADSEGDIYLTGYWYGSQLQFDAVTINVDSSNPTVNNLRFYVAKFDSNGTCLWAKSGQSIEPNSFGSVSMSVFPDNNGGVAICGRFHHNTLTLDQVTLTKTTQNNNSSDMFVAKYNSNGVVMWAHNAGSMFQNSTYGYAVTIDSFDNVYVGGTFANTIQYGTIMLDSSISAQYYLVKFDATGNVIWAKTSEFGTNGYTVIRSLCTDNIGNIYAAGFAYASTINFNNNISLSNLGNLGAFFVTKFNSSGNTVWAKGVSNIDANNYISIDCNSEDDLFVGGSFDKTTLQIGATTLIKSTAYTDLFIGRLYLQPLSNNEFEKNDLVVFPNPAIDYVYIKNINSNSTYKIFNLLGSEVKKGFLQSENSSINLNSLKSGVYLIQIHDANGNQFAEKIVIE